MKCRRVVLVTVLTLRTVAPGKWATANLQNACWDDADVCPSSSITSESATGGTNIFQTSAQGTIVAGRHNKRQQPSQKADKATIRLDTPTSTEFAYKNRYWRPEWQTTRRCSSTVENSCEPCYGDRTGAECWTAAEPKNGYNMYGRVVHSSGNGSWFKYTNNVHVLCDSRKVKIDWQEISARNGELAMYWDGKEINDVNFPGLKMRSLHAGWGSVKMPLVNNSAHRGKVSIKNDRLGAHEFHMVFTPSGPNATAKLTKLWFSMPLTYAICEDTKVCLKTLEEHGEDGMMLRMDNKMQFDCLKNLDHGNSACGAWLNCLADNRRSILSMLKAAGTNETSDVVAPVSDSLECIRPELADPESWECDCYEEAMDACSHVDVAHTEVQCLRAHYCNREEVCSSWKLRFCTKDLESLQTELSSHSERALLQHAAWSQDQSSARSSDHVFDDSLAGKSCA